MARRALIARNACTAARAYGIAPNWSTAGQTWSSAPAPEACTRPRTRLQRLASGNGFADAEQCAQLLVCEAKIHSCQDTWQCELCQGTTSVVPTRFWFL